LAPVKAVVTDPGGVFDQGRDVLVQPDGSIVVAGSSGHTAEFVTADFGVARYDRRGRPDRRFGGDGRVSVDLRDGYDVANAVLRQRDGLIVAVGTAFPPDGTTPAFGLVRLRPDGSLDPTFGDGGTVVTGFADPTWAEAAALQPDGRIVVAGYSDSNLTARSHVTIARYRPDGSLDPTFGDGGIVTTTFDDDPLSLGRANDVAVDADGTIVVAGLTGNQTTSDVAVARLRPDGSLDTGFGDGGFAYVSRSDGAREEATALALLPRGGIALGLFLGSTWDLARLRSDGTLDPRFGEGGVVRTTTIGDIYDITAQPDGKLLVAGRTSPTNRQPDATVARFRHDGSLDRRFGTDGVTTTDVAAGTEQAAAVTVQSDRAVVIAGTTEKAAETDSDVLVARYHG
jgi:uncharacterized delta-60 repeat protein